MQKAIDIPAANQEAPPALEYILTSPERLNGFERYLKQDSKHKYLIFLEEIRQLHYECDLELLAADIRRIYHTFIEDGAPWSVKLSSQEAIRHHIETMDWKHYKSDELVAIFREAELEVVSFLNSEVVSFQSSADLPRRHSKPLPITTDGTRKRVVIVGGGFTGCTVASILDQMSYFEVVLIDNKDSFEYTPNIIKNLVRLQNSKSSFRIRHNRYVKNGRVIIGHAHAIAHDAKYITVNDSQISYDYLVLATGSTYRSQFKSSDTSTLYRASQLEIETEQLQAAKSILIIGGGLVGCELASEISRTYNGTDRPKKRITLIESSPSLVPRSTPDQSQNASNYLKKLGVQVVVGERLYQFDDYEDDKSIFLGASGTRYDDYDKIYYATGTKPASDILFRETDEFENCIDCNGRICVKPTLQVDHWNYQHVFAGGDVTNVKEEKTGYAATIAGVVIARNICRLEKNKPPISQSEKGTIAPPQKPLHGVQKHGGVGKEKLSIFQKTFSFLSPHWAALKRFDEDQFLRLVSGESSMTGAIIGRLPSKLTLDSSIGLQYDTTKKTNLTYPGRVAPAKDFRESSERLDSSVPDSQLSVKAAAT